GVVHGDSLWRAAQAYRNAHDPGDERKALQRLVQEAPRDPHHAEAQVLLSQIPANAPVVGPGEQPPAPQANTPTPKTPPETPNAPGERPMAPPEGAKPAAPTNRTAPQPAPPPNPERPPPTPPLSPSGG